jgi:F420-non-reducing hydrogenase large subunit
MTNRKITIDPITRLEGHGKIEIFLDDAGNVDRAYYQIPELRGFEVFALGRPAEDMPQITSRICGVCPTAHHMAGTKALDALYRVEPPETARKIRETIYSAFMLEDHALHFYILGGPDFIVGPDAPKEQRNVAGVIQKVGVETGKRVITMRRRLREFISYAGGKVIHPVFGLPGGVAKGIGREKIEGLKTLADDAVEFARFTLQVFRDIVLANKTYVELITSDMFTHRTYYMGTVDQNNRLNFYDGMIRIVDPDGNETHRFHPREYADVVAEHVVPWTYVKIPYIKKTGWHGLTEGPESGIFSVAPLARLNACEGLATPAAQEAYEEFFETLGGKPVHHTLANHWARVIEMIYAAERLQELANDPGIAGSDIRSIPDTVPTKGIAAVEAPRGTLFHHYETNERGLITRANLIVATQNNSGRISMGVEKAAKGLIRNGNVSEGLLNMVEMIFRAYDPCNACATHSLPGQMPLTVRIRDSNGSLVRTLSQ